MTAPRILLTKKAFFIFHKKKRNRCIRASLGLAGGALSSTRHSKQAASMRIPKSNLMRRDPWRNIPWGGQSSGVPWVHGLHHASVPPWAPCHAREIFALFLAVPTGQSTGDGFRRSEPTLELRPHSRGVSGANSGEQT